MPSKVCIEPKCPDRATYRGRCHRHQRERNRQTHRNRQVYNSKRWRILRRRVLFDEPMCRACKAEDTDTIATEVDHITPIEQGGPAWERSNLQPLCSFHHSKKTRAEQIGATP